MSAKKPFLKAKCVSSLLVKKEEKLVMIVDTHASLVQSCHMILVKQGQTCWTGQAERTGGNFLNSPSSDCGSVLGSLFLLVPLV